MKVLLALVIVGFIFGFTIKLSDMFWTWYFEKRIPNSHLKEIEKLKRMLKIYSKR